MKKLLFIFVITSTLTFFNTPPILAQACPSESIASTTNTDICETEIGRAIVLDPSGGGQCGPSTAVGIDCSNKQVGPDVYVGSAAYPNATGAQAFNDAVTWCNTNCSTGCCEIQRRHPTVCNNFQPICYRPAGAATPTPTPPNTICGGETEVCCAPPTECTTAGGGILSCCANGAGAGTCQADCNNPRGLPTPFPDFQPCAGFSIDGLGEDPAPGYEEEFPACQTCHESNGTYTALGCIPNDPSQFAASFVRILFAISGGIAFLIILYGSFLCLTSRGSTERTQSCRETITAAVVGLLLIIFSLMIIGILFGSDGIFPGWLTAVL